MKNIMYGFSLSRMGLYAVLSVMLAFLFFSVANAEDYEITKQEWDEYMKDSAFKEVDARLNKAFKALLNSLPPAEQAKLRDEQREWAIQREKDAFDKFPKGSDGYIQFFMAAGDARIQKLEEGSNISTMATNSYEDILDYNGKNFGLKGVSLMDRYSKGLVDAFFCQKAYQQGSWGYRGGDANDLEGLRELSSVAPLGLMASERFFYNDIEIIHKMNLITEIYGQAGNGDNEYDVKILVNNSTGFIFYISLISPNDSEDIFKILTRLYGTPKIYGSWSDSVLYDRKGDHVDEEIMTRSMFEHVLWKSKNEIALLNQTDSSYINYYVVNIDEFNNAVSQAYDYLVAKARSRKSEDAFFVGN